MNSISRVGFPVKNGFVMQGIICIVEYNVLYMYKGGYITKRKLVRLYRKAAVLDDFFCGDSLLSDMIVSGKFAWLYPYFDISR